VASILEVPGKLLLADFIRLPKGSLARALIASPALIKTLLPELPTFTKARSCGISVGGPDNRSRSTRDEKAMAGKFVRGHSLLVGAGGSLARRSDQDVCDAEGLSFAGIMHHCFEGDYRSLAVEVPARLRGRVWTSLPGRLERRDCPRLTSGWRIGSPPLGDCLGPTRSCCQNVAGALINVFDGQVLSPRR